MERQTDFKQKTCISLGIASMAWSEIPRGTFDSTLCGGLADELVEVHETILKSQTSELLKNFISLRQQTEVLLEKAVMSVNDSNELLDVLKSADKIIETYNNYLAPEIDINQISLCSCLVKV